jgi:hypothetical protein
MIPFVAIPPPSVGLDHATVTRFAQAQEAFDKLSTRMGLVGGDRATAEFQRRKAAVEQSFLDGGPPAAITSEAEVGREFELLRSRINLERWKLLDPLRDDLKRISDLMAEELLRVADREQAAYDSTLQTWGITVADSRRAGQILIRDGREDPTPAPSSPTSPLAAHCHGFANALKGSDAFGTPSIYESIARTWGNGSPVSPTELLQYLTSWSLSDLVKPGSTSTSEKPSRVARLSAALKTLAPVMP